MYFNYFNSKSLLSIFLGIAVMLSSCQKGPLPIFKDVSPHPGSPVVFIAGYESNGVHNVAKYWINGQEITLSDGTQDASANSIVVSDNNDVYVAGSDNGAVYWKNNREIRLPADDATSIFVSGNDIYVAGSYNYNVSDSPKAVYWKNGTEVLLDRDNVYGYWGGFSVNSIFVSGNDVYTAGYEGPNAVYWKNGKEIYLTGSTIGAAGFIHARSIYVSGQDIYVDAYETSPGSPFLEFWFAENGAFQPGSLSNPFNPGGGNSLFVSGSHVYIAGTQEVPARYLPTAAYWKDGNVISLPTSETNSFGNAIFVSGNGVYVAGYETATYPISYAVYWKDGVETKLTDGAQPAVATSIFIK
jgi:hypothetical protein